MSKAISIKEFASLVNLEKDFCERAMHDFSQEKLKRLGFLLCKNFSLSIEQALTMLYCPYYVIDIKISVNVYKDKKNRYRVKKPHFLRCLFRHLSIHNFTIENERIYLDNEMIDEKEAEEIWLII
ncbi:hypothetical protein CQA53_09570 [Helicobacter didelphidarum]|uniref:Uncharacterized protein n=1 Tax=Helicobacter didelphidarum TaxID=2040648 RepID=A0A3D8IA93_9HELI|nr:hypothetical protein [Helicobacter didelphidarum]RDU62057.1 hypothetical protein CQA53_09570 [Helicobacter didelphidarum]